jgi:tetratricopeptide (TPR) repeat protein
VDADLIAKLRRAFALHQQGDLGGAQTLYQEVLRLQPDQVDALHGAGLVAAQRGDPRGAVELIGRALELDPRNAAALCNRGLALREIRELDAALSDYDRAIEIQADFAEVYSNRGVVLLELQRLDAALASCDRAIAINPQLAEAYSNRGDVLKELNQLNEALDSYDEAIKRKPDLAEAYSNRANVLKELNRLDAALDSCNRAIEIRVDFAEAHSNRADVLWRLNRLDEALESCARALSIDPNLAQAHCNRGAVLSELGRLRTALASYDRAIAIDPGYAQAHSNRGHVLQKLGQLDGAVRDYDKAIAIDPQLAVAHFNRSTALLLSGDFDKGLGGYEWRWKSEFGKSFEELGRFHQPRWTGKEAISGKTILLHSEQGLGDALQFCRYAPLVAESGAKVILEAPESLATLLRNLEGVSQIVANGKPLPHFDYQCPLLSLPLAFGTRLDTIPAPGRYLHADPSKVAEWRARLGAKTKPRIGLVFSGNPNHRNDARRSVALADLIRYLPADFEYFCLQTEVRDSDVRTLEACPMVSHFRAELEAGFHETAALCECLDLVISVDTSVAHLSGALGRKTWILLPRVPDWRWLLDRSDSPWYPTMTLFRQERRDDWTGVLGQLGSRLASDFHQ